MNSYKVKSWTNTWVEENGFPEEGLSVFTSAPSSKNIGVCFSGGGTRSAACTLGQLKALEETGVINNTKYISAVSGGAWAAVPYTFAPSAKVESYFGRIKNPEDINSDSSSLAVIPGSLQSSIVNSGVLGRLIKAGFSGKGDESYAHVLGDIFLKPFSLHNPASSFTLNNETKTKALMGNVPEDHDFDMARDGVPFLIVGATLLNKDGINSTKKYHVEYTPYYSGIKVAHIDKDVITKDDFFGGGYVTSFGYDSIGPYKMEACTDGNVAFTMRRAKKAWLDRTNVKAFSLSDIIASTGAAPQGVTEAIGLKSIGFPEFNHLPIKVDDGYKQVVEEYSHSDGGHLENLGIMPLLARGVEKIYCFVNTKKSFVPDDTDAIKSTINKSLKALFVPIDNFLHLSKFDSNVVFDSGSDKLLELIKTFKELGEKHAESGEFVAEEALIAKSQLTTIDNSLYGIKAGHNVEIVWVYNCRSKDWEDKLSDKALAKKIGKQKYLIGNQGGLEDFPHYGTFLENMNGVIKLKPHQTSLLTNLSYWVAKKALTDY